MTRRTAIIPLFLVALVVILANRAGELPAVQDTYAAAAAPSASYGDAETISVASGGLGLCAPGEVSYLRFDLSGLEQGPVGNVALVLETTYAAGGNTGRLALYAAPDSLAGETLPWHETTLTWSNRPAVDGLAPLATAAVPASGGPLRLESQALTNVTNREASFGGRSAGDDVLSLALLIEGCTGLNSVVRFASAEHGRAPGPLLTFSPPLQMFLPLMR